MRYDERPIDDTPIHTADLPPTPIRDRNIPATAWVEAPESLLTLGDDLPDRPVAEYKRRIGPWLLWRAGPAKGADARYWAVAPRPARRAGDPPALPRRLGGRPRPQRRTPRSLPCLERGPGQIRDLTNHEAPQRIDLRRVPRGWRARLTIDGTTYTTKGRKQRDAVDQIATQPGIRFDDVRALLKAATKARPNRGARSQLDGFDGIGEPKWYGQYIDAQGHRRKVSGRTSDEVSRKLRRKFNAAEDGLPTGHGNMTVGDLIELWFGRVKEGLQPLYVDGHHWEQVTPSTQSRYEWITTMLSDEYGRVRLKALDADRVELGLRSASLQASTVGATRPASQPR